MCNIFRLYTLFMIIVYEGLSLANTKDEFGIETGLRVIYNNYRRCEKESKDAVVTCFKLKAVKLADRILSINNIPITEGISLTKKEEKSPRAIDDGTLSSMSNVTEETNLPVDLTERNKRLDQMLWDRLYKFVESRSLQFRINRLFSSDNNNNDLSMEQEDSRDGRAKKDKNKGMYMYMMMMKGGMLALAYKGLALLAGKALLVSKIALTLALLVAAKKLFSHGHSAKTTYEIVKTPVITHSHQYAGAAAATHGHYGTGDFSSYDGSPYARSLDTTIEDDDETASSNRKNNNINYRIIEPVSYHHHAVAPPIQKYATHIIETVQGRSLLSPSTATTSDLDDDDGKASIQGRSLSLRRHNYDDDVDDEDDNDGDSDNGNKNKEKRISDDEYLKNYANDNKGHLKRGTQMPSIIPYAHLLAYRKQLNPNNNSNKKFVVLASKVPMVISPIQEASTTTLTNENPKPLTTTTTTTTDRSI